MPEPTSVLDVIKSARESAGAPTITRESVDAANIAAKEAVKQEASVAATAAVKESNDAAAEKPEGEKASVAFKAAYVSDDGVIYLIGAYAGNVDKDNEVLQTKALVDMSYDFCSAASRVFKCNHKTEIGADLVASMPGAPRLKSGRILKFGEEHPENDPITGIDLDAEPIAWFVGVRPHDKSVAEKAKAGEIVGSSWGAFVDRIAL